MDLHPCVAAAVRHRRTTWLIAVLLAAVIAIGATLALGRSPAAGQGGPTAERPYVAYAPGAAADGPLGEPTEEPTPAAETVAVVAYFLRDGLVAPAHREVPDTLAIGTAALEALLAGPSEDESGLETAIPDDSELLGLVIEDGVATVDLSGEFASGGGSFSVRARIAQVVYTLTQFETVDGVLFAIDGEPVEVFSSEGLVLDGPATSADFEDLTPAILVQSPAQGATIASPVRITGTANVFEAVFQLQILDGDGQILADEVVMATSGTGTRGTFDVTVPFDAEATGSGLIKVFVYSAQDGEPENVVEIPITLQVDDEPNPGGETVTFLTYFLRDEQVAAVHREVGETLAVANAAMEALLAGPTDEEAASGLVSTVPEGTELLGITISDGVASVDLSGEFESGGGSLSMLTRLAQVVYTLTQFETVDGVIFFLDGERVEEFSGEGVILDEPVGPDDFESVTPAILVQQPGQGATIASPVRITGTANTFEATFILRIEDESGETLAEEVITATSGSGTRGTFDVTIPYELAETGPGLIIVYEASAQDGEPINVVEIPVTLTP